MKMFKKMLRYTSTIMVVSFICVAQANAANYFLDGGVSLKRLEFKAQSSGGSYTLTPLFTMLSVTGGVVNNRYYVTANIEKSLYDTKLNGAVDPGDKDTLSRSDNSVTVGYYIKNNVSVFAGYLTGETKDNYSILNETGNFSFTEKGLYAGANYLIILSKGALSLNFAYAFLNGEYDQTKNTISGTTPVKYDGDTSGVSLGAKFVGQLMPQLNYYVGGKINLFKFSSSQFDTEENFYIAQAGITRKF